jgi:hypothetical protein
VNVLLCGCSVPVGEDMTIRAIHPPCPWDNHCFCLIFETCLLPKGKQREGEGDIMDDYFYMVPSQKVWRQNNLGSNGWEETSLGSLLLTIKVTYII